MTIWKPSPFIRVKVIGLAWRGGRLLAAEVEGSSGRIKGVRPLGGCIEFGESREEALSRELREELGCGAVLTGPWHALENLYLHEGEVGHEYVFAANVRLDDPAIYTRDRIAFQEDNGLLCSAGWFPPLDLPQDVALYPHGLRPLIQAGVVSPPA